MGQIPARSAVNIVLVDGNELDARGHCILTDRRARHIANVLRATPGSKVRVGVVGGRRGTAVLFAVSTEAVSMMVELEHAGPPTPTVHLALAVPRPKVLARAIEAAASFGVGSIHLFNSWRVDKSYLHSAKLDATTLAHHAQLGCEQGGNTWVPSVRVHDRFMAFVAALPAPSTSQRRLVCHPHADGLIESRPSTLGRETLLAIGPEGGFIEREVVTLTEHGFTPVSLGLPILRVETALAAALGQLALLDRLVTG